MIQQAIAEGATKSYEMYVSIVLRFISGSER